MAKRAKRVEVPRLVVWKARKQAYSELPFPAKIEWLRGERDKADRIAQELSAFAYHTPAVVQALRELREVSAARTRDLTDQEPFVEGRPHSLEAWIGAILVDEGFGVASAVVAAWVMTPEPEDDEVIRGRKKRIHRAQVVRAKMLRVAHKEPGRSGFQQISMSDPVTGERLELGVRSQVAFVDELAARRARR
jgi:hypothetical protein